MEQFCENMFRGVLYINCVHLIQSRGILINCHFLFFLRAIYLIMIIGYCFQRSNGCNIVGMFICSFFKFFLVCVYTLYSVYIYRCVNQCACMCVCVQMCKCQWMYMCEVTACGCAYSMYCTSGYYIHVRFGACIACMCICELTLNVRMYR